MTRSELARAQRLLKQLDMWRQAEAEVGGAFCQIRVSMADGTRLHVNDYDESLPLYLIEAVARMVSEQISAFEDALARLGVDHQSTRHDRMSV